MHQIVTCDSVSITKVMKTNTFTETTQVKQYASQHYTCRSNTENLWTKNKDYHLRVRFPQHQWVLAPKYSSNLQLNHPYLRYLAFACGYSCPPLVEHKVSSNL